MSVILPDNGRPAPYHAPCSLWSLRTSLSSPCISTEWCFSVNQRIWYDSTEISFSLQEWHTFFHHTVFEMQCECILSHDIFCSSRFVSSFRKFLLVISTFLFQCPFIIADIATISCCVPHNKQVCYQLLVQQEWTPALFSLHYLPWHITCLLIYLIYLRFKTISCFFFFFKVLISVSIFLLFSTPQTVQSPYWATSLFFHLFLFFFFKAKVISSVPSLSAAHARRTLCFILLWTLFNFAQ